MEQARAVREGMDKVLRNRMNIISYLPAWLIDERICGKKDYEVSKLKSFSIYTNGRNADNMYIKRFWRVLGTFSKE